MREEFDAQSKRDMDTRSQGICESDRMPLGIRGMFPIECLNTAREYDHVLPEGLRDENDRQRKLTADDGAKLCEPCHKIKTAADKADMARRRKFTPDKSRKPKTKTRSSRKLQGRGFDKKFTRTIASKNKPSKAVRRDA
jgi:hypothetical protein